MQSAPWFAHNQQKSRTHASRRAISTTVSALLSAAKPRSRATRHAIMQQRRPAASRMCRRPSSWPRVRANATACHSATATGTGTGMRACTHRRGTQRHARGQQRRRAPHRPPVGPGANTYVNARAQVPCFAARRHAPLVPTPQRPPTTTPTYDHHTTSSQARTHAGADAQTPLHSRSRARRQGGAHSG